MSKIASIKIYHRSALILFAVLNLSAIFYLAFSREYKNTCELSAFSVKSLDETFPVARNAFIPMYPTKGFIY